MKRRLTLVLACAALTAVFGTTSVFAQSRAGSDTQPVNRLWFGSPSELDRISQMVEIGRTEDAVELAQDFAGKMKAGPYHYDALNALCVALNANKQSDEAITVCNEAIEKRPSHWMAYNSRGTAYFTKGEYEKAVEDYSQALQLYPSSDTVKFNLALAQSRLNP